MICTFCGRFFLQEQQRALGSAQQQDQLAQDAYSMNLIALEEQQFQEYANKVIEHGKKTGRNVYPLQRAAKVSADAAGCVLLQPRACASMMVQDRLVLRSILHSAV